jgi:hypothetical protein
MFGYRFHVPTFEHMVVPNLDEYRLIVPYYQLHPFPTMCRCTYITAGLIQRKWRSYITRKKYLAARPLQRMYQAPDPQFPIYKISRDNLQHIFSYLLGEFDVRPLLVIEDELEHAKNLSLDTK